MKGISRVDEKGTRSESVTTTITVFDRKEAKSHWVTEKALPHRKCAGISQDTCRMMNGLTQLGVKSATGFLRMPLHSTCMLVYPFKPVALFQPNAERAFCLEV